jgi:hypothetical protein
MAHDELNMAEVLQAQIHAEKALSERLKAFPGEWVAVRDHDVAYHAETLEQLMELVGAEELEVFEVSAEAGSVCFF